MKQQASVPVFNADLDAACGAGGVVGVRYFYDAGEPVTAVHSLNSFHTENEALLFTAKTNGKVQ